LQSPSGPSLAPRPCAISGPPVSRQPPTGRKARTASYALPFLGLMAYGVDRRDLMHRAANYVDRILRAKRRRTSRSNKPDRSQLMINIKPRRRSVSTFRRRCMRSPRRCSNKRRRSEPLGREVAYSQRVCNSHACNSWLGRRAAMGLVSRVTPVHTAMRNCTRDEGRSFEVGNQVLISSHRMLLSTKATVVNVAEKSEQDSDRHD